MKQSLRLTILMFALTLAAGAHADPVQTARDGYWHYLGEFAVDRVGLADVERAYDRLRVSKREPDVVEADECEEETVQPLPNPEFGYGRGLFSFSPELNMARQVSSVDVSGWRTEDAEFELEVQPIEYRNGAEDITVRKIPGGRKYSSIQYKRGDNQDIPWRAWVDLAR